MKMIRHEHECMNPNGVGRRNRVEEVGKYLPGKVQAAREGSPVISSIGDVVRMAIRTNDGLARHWSPERNCHTMPHQENAAPAKPKGSGYLLVLPIKDHELLLRRAPDDVSAVVVVEADRPDV